MSQGKGSATMKSSRKERGAAAILVICAMTAVFCMAWGLNAVVQYGAEGSEEFLQETRLRLAAEGQVEKLAREIELHPELLAALPKGTWQSYGEAASYKGILVTSSIRHVKAQKADDEEDIFLKAWAEPEEKLRWSKGKIVCGWLHRKGDTCVWQGWRSAED